jgi:hemolysin-activating ACP:hemolysin acyltransferase
VAQVLGEITWLMTQSPRHKQVPLGDLEWLVMPAILLKQFRMFYKGEQPSVSRCGRWWMTSWRSGSMRVTSG